MMDCDTTGIEPDLALVKFKKLVGGGLIKIVNNTVPEALLKLGYSPEEMEKIVAHVDQTGWHRRRPRFEAGAPARFRLLSRGKWWSFHCMARTRRHDGRRAAVPFGRDQQDHQHARRIHG